MSETPSLCKMIPFSLYASKATTKTRDSDPTRPNALKSGDYPALRVFSRRVEQLRTIFETQVVEDSSFAVFQLFPDMDVNRRYDMQEARLGRHLAGAYGASNNSTGRGRCLARWNANGSRGCLGAEVRTAMEVSVAVRVPPCIVTDSRSAV